VRETAINAHLAVRKDQKGNEDFYTSRKKRIVDSGKWTEELNYSKLTSSILHGKKSNTKT